MTQTPLHETDETDVKTTSASRRVRLFPDVTDNDNGPDKYILVKSMGAGASVEGNYISGGSMLAEDGSSACVSAGAGEAVRADKSEGSGAAIAVSLTPTASIAIATLSQLENELENEHNSSASGIGIDSFNCSMEHTLESSPTNPTITVFRERWREVIVVTCLAALWGVSYYTVFVWMSYYVSKPELMSGLENDSQVEKESEVSVLDRY